MKIKPQTRYTPSRVSVYIKRHVYLSILNVTCICLY